MTLLISVFAAIIVTILWYRSPDDKMQLGFMALMFWGASLMWFVDAIFEYAELRAEYFEQAPADMLNDAYLGLCVVALGIIIWLVRLMIKDPNRKIAKSLKRI